MGSGKLAMPTGCPPGSDELRPMGQWYERGGKDFAVFRAASERLSFSTGVGLPGRVLASGSPILSADLGQRMRRSCVAMKRRLAGWPQDLPFRCERASAVGPWSVLFDTPGSRRGVADSIDGANHFAVGADFFPSLGGTGTHPHPRGNSNGRCRSARNCCRPRSGSWT